MGLAMMTLIACIFVCRLPEVLMYTAWTAVGFGAVSVICKAIEFHQLKKH
jgi:hypothetical protein